MNRNDRDDSSRRDPRDRQGYEFEREGRFNQQSGGHQRFSSRRDIGGDDHFDMGQRRDMERDGNEVYRGGGGEGRPSEGMYQGRERYDRGYGDQDRGSSGGSGGHNYNEQAGRGFGSQGGRGGEQWGQGGHGGYGGRGSEQWGQGSQGSYSGRSHEGGFGGRGNEQWAQGGFGGRGGEGGIGGRGGGGSYGGHGQESGFGGRSQESGFGGRGGESWGHGGQGGSMSGSSGSEYMGSGSTGMGGMTSGSMGRGQGMQQGARGMHAGRGPRGYKRSDERIREDVCDRLMQHDEIDASEIDVTVSGGEVTLQGTVESRQMKHMIENVIDSVHGVQEVHNQLRIKRSQEAGSGDSRSTMQQGQSGTQGAQGAATHGITETQKTQGQGAEITGKTQESGGGKTEGKNEANRRNSAS